jgi:predicted HTH transcriptional regulator
MFEEMEESFLHAPLLSVEAGEFCVTLRNEPIFSGPSTEWQGLVQGLTLSAAQKRILLAHPAGFTNEDYRRLNNVDRDQAYREIQEMVVAGAVTPAEAPGRGAVYRIAPDLHDARAFLSARLPRLRDHLARQGHLRNANYREMFDTTRFVAWRELKHLVSAGYLRMEGDRRGARYLPGPALPEQEGPR